MERLMMAFVFITLHGQSFDQSVSQSVCLSAVPLYILLRICMSVPVGLPGSAADFIHSNQFALHEWPSNERAYCCDISRPRLTGQATKQPVGTRHNRSNATTAYIHTPSYMYIHIYIWRGSGLGGYQVACEVLILKSVTLECAAHVTDQVGD